MMGGRYQVIGMGKGWVVIDSQDKGRVVFASDSKIECVEWTLWAKGQ
jgi:hypothetical protein